MLQLWKQVREQTKSSLWAWGKTAVATVCVSALLVALSERPAHAIGFGDVLSALGAINSTLKSAVAAPLNTIQGIESSIASYEQQVLYPISAINQLKGVVSGLQNQIKRTNNIMNLSYSSAQLPNTRQLENLLVSSDPNSINNVSSAFQQVYGALPSNTQAPPDVRNVVDMSDAQAQDAMKKAIQLEALAARELEVSGDLQTQIANATPGTAPMLEAVAAAWVVRANAYSQSAMAQLMRVRSAAVANQSALVKRSANGSAGYHDLLQQVLSH